MLKSNWHRHLVQGASTLAILTSFDVASAQTVVAETQVATETPQDTSSAIGDIVVTASRRAQRLQDVGISVTALGSEQLTALGVKQTVDIVAQVPGMKFNQFSPAITVFNLRGVSQNDFGDQLEPPVAVYIDDGYVATMGGAGVPTFDLDRVEVLRGPQGTLFGRNATGGLVNFISKRPTKTTQGYIDINGGTNANFHAEAGIGGPLADWAQFRISGIYNHRDGFMKNSVGSDLGQQNNYAVRAQLAVQPADSLQILLIGRYARNINESVGGYASAVAYLNGDGLGALAGPTTPSPFGTAPGTDISGYRQNDDPFRVANDQSGRFNRKVWGGQVRVEWDLGSATLSSVTDYQNVAKYTGEDSDGSPSPIFRLEYGQRMSQISEELKISGKGPNFRYTGGFYYLNWTSNQSIHSTTVDSAALFGSDQGTYLSGYDGRYKTKNWSVFAQGEYDLTNKLTVIAGARYLQDRKTVDYLYADNFGDTLIFNPQTCFQDQPSYGIPPSNCNPALARASFNAYSLRGEVDYHVNRDVLLYASFNRGVKGPNFAAPIFGPVQATDLPHKGETLYAYEAGLKSTLLDGKLRVNIGGYIYNYKNYQAFSFQNLVTKITNLDATAKGVEAEITALPVTGLQIGVGVALEESNVKNLGLPTGRRVDTDLPQAPGISGNWLVRYEHPLSNDRKATIQFDGTVTDHFTFTVIPAPLARESAYAVGNVRVSIADIDGKWEIAAFAKNLWNTKYRLYTTDAAFIGLANNIWAEPRWAGVQVRYQFGQ